MQKYKKYLFFIFLCCFLSLRLFLGVVCRLQVATFKAASLQPLRAFCFCSRHKRRKQIYFLLVGVLGWCGYLHALNLVCLVRVSWLVWLPACLEPRVLGSCPGWCGYLHTLNLVPAGSCPCWFVWFVLVGSGYLHALNLVSLVRALLVRVSWLEVVTCIP